MQEIPLAGTWRGWSAGHSRARRGERERLALALRLCRDGERDSWLTVFCETTLRSCDKCRMQKECTVSTFYFKVCESVLLRHYLHYDMQMWVENYKSPP